MLSLGLSYWTGDLEMLGLGRWAEDLETLSLVCLGFWAAGLWI